MITPTSNMMNISIIFFNTISDIKISFLAFYKKTDKISNQFKKYFSQIRSSQLPVRSQLSEASLKSFSK